MNLFRNKKCPRCGQKVIVESMVCPGCRLNFQKFEEATNAEAKKAIRQKEKERVLMRKGCPPDVNKIKLLILAMFFGCFGVHHYYVGRYKMGLFYSIECLIGIINAALVSIYKSIDGIIYEIFSIFVIVWGFVIFFWFIDVANIILNKYKVPVGRS